MSIHHTTTAITCPHCGTTAVLRDPADPAAAHHGPQQLAAICLACAAQFTTTVPGFPMPLFPAGGAPPAPPSLTDLNPWDRWTQLAHPYWFVWAPQDQYAAIARWHKALDIDIRAITINYAIDDHNTETFTITSTTDKHQHYKVSITHCTCPDYPKAPWGWCKHRFAVWQYNDRHRYQPRTRTSQEIAADLDALFGPSDNDG